MFNDKVILITGGTGSLGYAITKHLLENYTPAKIIIFSRDEMKQWEMRKSFGEDPRLRFFIGDVRDRDRLYRAFDRVDLVVHAAATKIVPVAEYNPFECIKTNIIGAMNVIDASIDNKVAGVVALSTDKASSPINLYGATKLASDKLFVSANVYSSYKTKFSVVRYGNVIGSRGSVIPFFLNLKKNATLPITDVRMTRFMITLKEGIDLISQSFEEMYGGEIFVKKIPSMKVVDIATCLRPDLEQEEVGIRPGEKLHEQMISPEDARNTYDFGDFYKIIPDFYDEEVKAKVTCGGNLVPSNFEYNSQNNTDWMTPDHLLSLVEMGQFNLL